MPTLVQIGAGNIGRGFIAELFASAGWSVVFVDVNAAVVAELNRRGGYQVIAVDEAGEHPVAVRGVRAIDGRDQAAVIDLLTRADLVSCAVGLGALRHLGAPLAAAIARRSLPLDVLVCENGATAAEQLRAAVVAAGGNGDRLGTVRTSIGRMIPAAAPGGDLLDIRVEPYRHLPVERAAFRGVPPTVDGLDLAEDFTLVLRQKLYLHNLTHACLAYAGHLRACATIPDCVAIPDLAAAARAAGDQAAEALARAHGRDAQQQAAIRADQQAMLDDLFVRYRNRALGDPVARVARDPMRKLAADDRLVGAARLCIAHGVDCRAILDHILLACRYTPAADEPGAESWLAARRSGPIAQLTLTTALSLEDPFMSALALASRRQAAANAMRQAGIVLRDDEAAALEIADFGLGRFEQFGLAIHVYVNTDRCCAKELVMLPGQICPEHRHPPIAGEPGKEETFRVRQGEVFLFLPGHKQDPAEKAAALKHVPADKHAAFTMYKCVHLTPGTQYTLKPNTPHWFVAGSQGAIVSEFSTKSRDEADVFTDPAIKRVPDAA